MALLCSFKQAAVHALYFFFFDSSSDKGNFQIIVSKISEVVDAHKAGEKTLLDHETSRLVAVPPFLAR